MSQLRQILHAENLIISNSSIVFIMHCHWCMYLDSDSERNSNCLLSFFYHQLFLQEAVLLKSAY